MRLLIDTPVLVWWFTDPPRLSMAERAAVADPANEVWYSPASLWEMEIKRGMGRIRFDTSEFVAALDQGGFRELRISTAHALAAGRLTGDEDDAFDRMLAAQAICEGLMVVTHDPAFQGYGTMVLPE